MTSKNYGGNFDGRLSLIGANLRGKNMTASNGVLGPLTKAFIYQVIFLLLPFIVYTTVYTSSKTLLNSKVTY